MTEINLLNKGPFSDDQRIEKIKKLIKAGKLVTTGDRIYSIQNRELFIFIKEEDGATSLCTPVGIRICEANNLHAFCVDYALDQFKKNVDTILRNLDFNALEVNTDDGTE